MPQSCLLCLFNYRFSRMLLKFFRRPPLTSEPGEAAVDIANRNRASKLWKFRTKSRRPLMFSAQFPIVVVCRIAHSTGQFAALVDEDELRKNILVEWLEMSEQLEVIWPFSGWRIFYSEASEQCAFGFMSPDDWGNRCSIRWKSFVHLDGNYLHSTVGWWSSLPVLV